MPPVAASDAGKEPKHKKSSTSSPHSNGNDNGNTRLCHIVKRADFDGYGFNLHSEKSKPGQYIGKIDKNSPAEAAGLKEGDRILEVNGLPIGSETHKQVVLRIKAIAWEVKLLVTNEPLQSTSNKNSNTKNIKEEKITKDNEKKAIPMKSTSPSPSPPPPPPSSSSSPSKTATKNGTSNNIVSVANGNNAPSSTKSTIHQSNSNMTTPTTPTNPPPPLTPPLPSKVSSNVADISSNGNSNENNTGTLKLPSTAAEMRAILQSKKKYNPKSDDVNLQKKYDIIQKL